MDSTRAADLRTPPTTTPDYDVGLVSLNQWQIAWRRFRRHRLAMFGAGLFLAIVAGAIVLPFFFPYDFYEIPTPDPACRIGCPPNAEHWFGTTGGLQRDVFTLVVNGARISLLIGLGAAVGAAFIGSIVGGFAGYFGGWTDNFLMRVVDVLLSLPLLFVILVVAKFLGGGNWFMILFVFTVFGWAGIARLVRSLFLTLRNETFVEAARAAGVSNRRIIFRHILPNAVSPIIVASTLAVAGVIVGEAFVSFLGFGVDITTPTWGNALSNSLTFIPQGNWWWPLFPGLAIVLTVLGINFMGDGLRDALDPAEQVLTRAAADRRDERREATSSVIGPPRDPNVLLEVRGLRTYFHVMDGTVKAVDGVDFKIERGATLGLVGESGCGKSVTAHTIMRLIESPPGEIAEGEIWFDGRDLLTLSEDQMRHVRGDDIAMIFQEPMTSLNPVFTVGDQIEEAVRLHQRVSEREARNRAIESLRLVGLSAPERRVSQYPHEMSGGMRQRVMIAMALSCNPKLLIADEPTTALDVTIQAQILELIREIQTRTGTALLLITHDLAVVAETVQNLAVMYAGRIVETGTVNEVLLNPKMPYTQGLLNSIPGEGKRGKALSAIEGVVPNPFRMPPGCKFQPRCPFQWERCLTEPELLTVGGPERRARCWLHAPEEGARREVYDAAAAATVRDVVG